MKNIVILGATGSIGTQTLDVARAIPGQICPIGLSAHSSWASLFEQAAEFQPRWITLTDESQKPDIPANKLPSTTELLWGEAGVEQMVTDAETEIVVAAMVGAAGLRGTVVALQAGKDIALANKETLVVGGPVVTELAKRNSAQLLPVDSEHSAIFQCLQNGRPDEVARIILTASGGPFRRRPAGTFEEITVEEALEHPTWTMGPKITIDSATMMNKALEIIEAHWLFGLPAEQIDIVVHPPVDRALSRGIRRWERHHTGVAARHAASHPIRVDVSGPSSRPDSQARLVRVRAMGFRAARSGSIPGTSTRLRGRPTSRDLRGGAQRCQRGRHRTVPGERNRLSRHCADL